jgi:hypothetical protein
MQYTNYKTENVQNLKSISLRKQVSIIKLSTACNRFNLILDIIEEYVTYLI